MKLARIGTVSESRGLAYCYVALEKVKNRFFKSRSNSIEILRGQIKGVQQTKLKLNFKMIIIIIMTIIINDYYYTRTR